jgi:hypothetical protein
MNSKEQSSKFFQLLPLECSKCGEAITCGRYDMVYFCDNCGTTQEFTGEKLSPVETLFARPLLGKVQKTEIFLPFWVFHLDISIKGKKVYLPLLFSESLFKKETSLFSDESVMEEILSKRKTYEKEKELDFIIYVPSFPTSGTFSYSADIGNRFTKSQPELKFFEETKKMEYCIYNSSDGLAIAEDEYISLQSQIIPNLLNLQLSFKVKDKKVVGIPYRKEKGVYYDQIIGEMILKNALKLE